MEVDNDEIDDDDDSFDDDDGGDEAGFLNFSRFRKCPAWWLLPGSYVLCMSWPPGSVFWRLRCLHYPESWTFGVWLTAEAAKDKALSELSCVVASARGELFIGVGYNLILNTQVAPLSRNDGAWCLHYPETWTFGEWLTAEAAKDKVVTLTRKLNMWCTPDNMQTIRLRPTDNLAGVIADEKKSCTPLTEFFRTSATEGCPKLLYGEFAEHYRWDTGSRTWEKRRNKVIAIGILVFVAPAEGERFFLRLLLLHIRGPTSFEYLKTVDGYVCATFQEAALRHRLLEEEDAAELCMGEACAMQMPIALRRLFSTLLIFAQPKDPSLLWSTHYESLSDDFRFQFPDDPLKVSQLTARAVERYLEAMGKTMAEFELDHLDTFTDDDVRRTRDIVDALDAAIPEDCRLCKSLLNPTQKEAFTTIMEHIQTSKPGAFFIDGPGGTGKTFLYKALYAEVRMMGEIILPTASSGIAAANIPGGQTTHSQFKIPLECVISLACDVPKQSSLAALIRASSLIIWDEASMSKRQNIESLDHLLRDLCDPNQLFGGKVVVFGGDFRQTLPILPRKSQREVVEASLFSSHLWPKLIKFSLTENLRAKDDPEFAKFLLVLGNGELQTKEFESIELPDGLVRVLDRSNPNPIADLAALAFPELELGTFDSNLFTDRVILTPLNDDVDAINDALIDQFPGQSVTYTSHDSMLDDTCADYPAEFINKLNPGGMSPHKLILKENCPVILIRNLQPSFGLCNGTRLICKRFLPNTIECVIMTGQNRGDIVLIPRIKLRPAP
ncbi:uncharacterized protein LOC141618442 [Silene latifolia]|uniref:uncharacterized protein LOC141618442 n=1 Tax=Silene latifolia TaxID=37657 RepID=UPI003D7867B1